MRLDVLDLNCSREELRLIHVVDALQMFIFILMCGSSSASGLRKHDILRDSKEVVGALNISVWSAFTLLLCRVS